MICVPEDSVNDAFDILRAANQEAFLIGEIAHAGSGEEQVELVGINQ